ncbi:hypothetical protein RFI_22524 [Reticulomyxa filosa]|uniref:Uncharacterized protein n=1 Tax=Reticulomyxa filosa TaxID=46433 RepID=X6MP45_RETFI|nr:hypothetical protein RFI_22524 [Reticulomyxa filosa]|eukprot:ETO14845.1 hypothetical protein RFI_22524 [Reticulomyxa filosa]
MQSKIILFVDRSQSTVLAPFLALLDEMYHQTPDDDCNDFSDIENVLRRHNLSDDVRDDILKAFQVTTKVVSIEENEAIIKTKEKLKEYKKREKDTRERQKEIAKVGKQCKESINAKMEELMSILKTRKTELIDQVSIMEEIEHKKYERMIELLQECQQDMEEVFKTKQTNILKKKKK